MVTAVEQEKPDYLVHLGDGWRDVDEVRRLYPQLPIAQVCGNCDWGCFELEDQLLVKYGSTSVLMCHGHMYQVKQSLLRLTYAAMEQGAKIALFGHTHQPYCQLHDGIWLMNPGSCGYGYRPTYGVMELSGEEVTCTIKAIEERNTHV